MGALVIAGVCQLTVEFFSGKPVVLQHPGTIRARAACRWFSLGMVPMNHDLGPLGPAWIVACCHEAGSYEEGGAIIEAFIDDPARYWRERGIPLDKVRQARDNLIKAGVPIPVYIDEALAGT